MKESLTQQQTEKLLALGVSKDKASIKEDMYGPALFTLTDLLKLLPSTLKVGDDRYIFKIEGDENGEDYWVSYYHYIFHEGSAMPLSLWAGAEPELIDALYIAVVWYYGFFLIALKK